MNTPIARLLPSRSIALAVGLLLSMPLLADDPRLLIETSHGAILVELNPEDAPKTVENVLAYADNGTYDGTIFHRVIDGFMIQGGGFNQDYERVKTRAPIRNEADNGLKNQRGTLAMARTQDPHSATSQFFINLVNNDFLNHRRPDPRGWGYTVFGEVIDGMEVVDTIGGVATGAVGPFPDDAPLTPVVIKRVKRYTGNTIESDQEEENDA
jgi:cyclophilin family peptidyl-prolyl cis-trans isomerase